MKKLFLILITAILFLSCDSDVKMAERQYENTTESSRFIIVENASTWLVAYDKETLVMYAISDLGEGKGVFTVLVNADGSPLLWKGSQPTNTSDDILNEEFN